MAKQPAHPYSLHPSVAYVQAILANLEKNSGRDLDAWIRMLQAKGPKDAKARVAWLKAQGLGGTQAGVVAQRSLDDAGHAFDDTPEGYLAMAPRYVEQQYAGKKATLRPLYDALLELALGLGKDIKACPCETIVPLYRNHVFAQLKATTLTRLDLGLALGDPANLKDPSGRLLDTGGFAKKDRLTHRIEVKVPADLDAMLERWLRTAYERDAR